MALISFAFFISLAPAGAALAQSSGISTEGTLSISAHGYGPDHGIGAVDITFSLPISRNGRFGLELGTFMYILPQKRPHETYVALTIDDRWRIGVVRPAYDFVLPSVFEEAAPHLAYARAEYSRAYTTTNAMRQGAVPWGLSYTDNRAPFGWAMSVHHAAVGGFSSASLAARWQHGAWRLAAAVEGVWSEAGDFDDINAKLGLSYVQDRWSIGLAWLHPEAEGLPDALALNAGFDVTDKLSLSLFGEFTDGGRDDAYGLAAHYAFHDRATLSLAATRWNDETGFHLTLTHRF
ncbi:hypothetical protein [Pacificoceanicola onchidii]|uniref:hypothetical protein n=1 Tax=Pacificoceanicola onchidii TaxID=2562685 RepID=UPI0010A619F5|nr:hypothetical protein [Pacificoceanicola onchidii]